MISDITFSKNAKYIATLSASGDGGGDKEHEYFTLSRARIWNIQTGLPVTDWLEYDQRANLETSSPHAFPFRNILWGDLSSVSPRPSIALSEDAERLSFFLGEHPYQIIHYGSKLRNQEITELTYLLSGLEPDTKSEKLQSIPVKKRFQRYQSINGSELLEQILSEK